MSGGDDPESEGNDGRATVTESDGDRGNDSSSVRRSDVWAADGKGLADIGQEHVAAFISGEISRDPDVRVAVEGPWGSGKTRILKLVKDRLTDTDHENSVVAWYDPWKYSPDETVLRRTLLDSVADAVEEQCTACKDKIQRKRFYQNVERERSKTDEELEQTIEDKKDAVWRVLKTRARFYLAFGLIWAGLFLVAGLASSYLPPALEAAPAAFVVAAGAALLAAIIQDAVQSVQIIELTPNLKMTLPKLDQIDQFEEEYKEVLECLADEGKNLVILVDDLDRCGDEEIQTVMSGLATYLETPHDKERGRVSFIVAIDEVRLLDAMDDQRRVDGRENLLQKHFHMVVPVPIATDTALLSVLDATLEEIEWDVNSVTKNRMANLVAAHGDSNLRILRAAVTEASSMERYYEEVLEPQGVEVADKLIDNPLLRFRIALIREVSDSQALREFLSDPRIWLEKMDRPKGIPWELFDMNPPFVRDRLDPRPLLGLAPGLRATAAYPATKEARSALKAGKDARVQQLLQGHQPESLISFTSILISSELPADPEEAGQFLTGLIGILGRARSALGTQDLSVFERILEHLEEHVQHQQFSDPRPQEWVKVAAAIGDEALEALFQPEVPLLQGNLQQGTLNALLDAAKDGRVNGKLAYQLHARIHGENQWKKLYGIARQLIREDQFEPFEEFHELQIRCMKQWNYDQKPQGPPSELYQEDLIGGVSDEQRRRAAAAYQVAASQNNEETRAFVSDLAEAGWPTTRPDDDAEEMEGLQDEEVNDR